MPLLTDILLTTGTKAGDYLTGEVCVLLEEGRKAATTSLHDL